MKYWLHPDAAAEHRKQVAYYEERQAGLGRRYHAAYRAALALACEAPHRHRIVFPPAIRRVGFQVFHFDLIYREVNGAIQVWLLPATVVSQITGRLGSNNRLVATGGSDVASSCLGAPAPQPERWASGEGRR